MQAVFWRVAALWFLLSWSGLGVDRSEATGTTAATVTLSPSILTIPGCATAEVEIRINDVVGLYGADVWLTFDPSLLEVVDTDPSSAEVRITNGGLLTPPLFYIARGADNTAGTVHFAATQLSPSSPVNGSGILTKVQFRAKSAGSSVLHFKYALLSDRSGAGISVAPVDGSTATIPPGKPVLTIRKLEDGAVRLGWSSVGGVAGYRLYRGATLDFEPIEPATCVFGGLECDDPMPLDSPGQARYYVTRATCANGFASASSNLAGEISFALEPGH